MSTSFFFWLLTAALSADADGDPLTITDRLIHIGDTEHTEWKDFTTVKPEHQIQVDLDFEARLNKKDLYLEVHAGGVGQDWKVKVNGKDVGVLEKKDELTAHFFKLPLSTLKDGKNRFTVASDKAGDDIYVGKAAIHDRPLAELKGYAHVRVFVKDAATGAGLACRLTVTQPQESKEEDKGKVKGERRRGWRGRASSKDKLVALTIDAEMATGKDKPPELAVRDGIIYAKNGVAGFSLPAGRYSIFASRGFEYSVQEADVVLKRLEEKVVELEIRREVDTTGYLAADTHIHTKTYSGHGDINMEERVIAIAGEGVEVAVATDHNHITDYGSTMEKVGAMDEFTSIRGDEVTVEGVGHFNAFPFDKGAKPPEHDHSDWVRLVAAMRSGAGVRAIILNHPRRALGSKSPLDRIRYNPITGEVHRGPGDLGIDAIEVLNGKTLDDDRFKILNDWFGLINRGHLMRAVAGSDSHSVHEVVGQARTYIASSTDDPRKLQIDEFCGNFLAGRMLVSLGLLTNIEVGGKYRVGDIVADAKGELDVKITVQGPSWTAADRIGLYLNGIEIKKEKIAPSENVIKFESTWRIPAPPHDAFLVAVASGPAITAPFWPIAGGEKKYVLGATNPIWIDADGDGKFTSAFEYAAGIARAYRLDGGGAQRELPKYDVAVTAQFASLARTQVQKDAQEAYERIMAEADRKLLALLETKDARVKKGFTDYLAAAPKVEVSTREERADEAARLKKDEEDRKKRREEAEKKRKEEEEKKRKEADEKKQRKRV